LKNTCIQAGVFIFKKSVDIINNHGKIIFVAKIQNKKTLTNEFLIDKIEILIDP
jgi:hypothetical protein